MHWQGSDRTTRQPLRRDPQQHRLLGASLYLAELDADPAVSQSLPAVLTRRLVAAYLERTAGKLAPLAHRTYVPRARRWRWVRFSRYKLD